jgi:NADH:ubiquinone oxidoreductase subunit E
MVAGGDKGRRRRRGDEVEPASDGTADAERRERQSGLRRALRLHFPERSRDNLLPALHFLQHEHGHLPEWALQVVGWHLRVPAAEVYGAATSYTELHLEPPKPRDIVVCTGLACWQSGSEELLNEIRQLPAPDDASHVTTTACAFMCGLAPAVRINGSWHGRAHAERLTSIIENAPL